MTNLAINELLNNPQRLVAMQEMVENGAAIAVIEARFEYARGTIKRWLDKGVKKEAAKTPYRVFYKMYRKWAAEATFSAQANLLSKNPGKWLETNTSAHVVDPDLKPVQDNTPSSSPPGIGGPQQGGNIVYLNLGSKDLIEGLSLLTQSNIDVNHAIVTGRIETLLKGPVSDEIQETSSIDAESKPIDPDSNNQ